MSTDREYRPWQVETRVGQQWVPWSTYHDFGRAAVRVERLIKEPDTRSRLRNLVTGEVLSSDQVADLQDLL